MAKYHVKEVLNYGGFFGGDTISAVCVPYEGGDERDFTIDEHVFDNLKDRYKVEKGFVLELETEGNKVSKARILAAPTREQLKEATDPHTSEEGIKLHRVFAYYCPSEELWIRSEPTEVSEGRYCCVLCEKEFRS